MMQGELAIKRIVFTPSDVTIKQNILSVSVPLYSISNNLNALILTVGINAGTA